MNDEPRDHSGIQILLLVALAAFAAHVIVQYRRGGLRALVAMFWIAVFGVGASAAAFPEGATRLARSVGVGRGADLVIYVALAGLSYVVFRLLVRQERTERRLTEIVREIALAERRRRDESPRT